MSEKIVLIDGHSILNRAFYGVPDLTNAEGLHTNAVYGFLNILFKILEEEKPEYLTVTFDVHAPTFRHEMFADYKGTRKPMAEELRQQVPVIKEVLKAMDDEREDLGSYVNLFGYNPKYGVSGRRIVGVRYEPQSFSKGLTRPEQTLPARVARR